MKPEQIRVLIECYRRQQALLAPRQRRPAWGRYSKDRYRQAGIDLDAEEQSVIGPRYSAFGWFPDCTTERQRQRYRRAVDGLVRNTGLLIGTKTGGRLTHLRLTPEGQEVARRRLAGEAATS
jgi:hypothetical protein